MIKIKKLIRTLLVIIGFSIFGFGAIILQNIILPLVKVTLKKDDVIKLKFNEILQKSWQFFIGLLKFFGIIRIDSKDIEKLKNIKNSIIISTHPSYIDVLILISIIPHSTCFVAERLMNNIFFNKIVKLLFISEGQPVEQWSQEAVEMLDNGFNLIIFPMGIRHRKNEHPKIRRGTALLAQKTKKNIIMINMETNFDFLQIHQPFYEAGSETVVYNVKYLGKIDTEEFLNKYSDEVTFKTELTKYIAKTLY